MAPHTRFLTVPQPIAPPLQSLQERLQSFYICDRLRASGHSTFSRMAVFAGSRDGDLPFETGWRISEQRHAAVEDRCHAQA